jgi:serine protease Do
MSPYDPESFDTDVPPPRPTTPPIRRGFLRVLGILLIITALAYGIPYTLDRAGYAWEAGRSRAASEALAKLDKDDVIGRSSYLFRMATRVITPAVVNIQTFVPQPGGFGQELGSGVIIDKDKGYIVTNEHVVHDAERIIVRIGRSNDVEGTLIGSDDRTDLAVVQVKGPVGVAAEWGDSERMEVGDWVIAVGSPFGLERTVTAGIVSATNRHGLIRGDRYEDFIQTDAAINPGNSGGPLINLRGQVIGINTAIIKPQEGQGIGMAISSDIARRVADQIIKNGKVVRAYLGIIPVPVTPDLARNLGLPEEQAGALVSGVRPDSPAAKAGLRPGDLVVRLDNKEVDDPSNLRTRAFTLPIGSKVPVEFYRGPNKQSVDVTVEAMPERMVMSPRALGFDVVDLPPGAGPGVRVAHVAPNSPARAADLREGMKIVGVGNRRVANRVEFEAAVAGTDLLHGLPLGILTPEGRLELLTVAPAGTSRP